MKYKTLFRLALKVIGVYLVAVNINVVIQIAFVLSEAFFNSQNTAVRIPQFSLQTMYIATSIAPLLIGLYLFFGGEWIVNKAIPSNRPYCHECGYELTHATSNTCPECGTEFKAAE